MPPATVISKGKGKKAKKAAPTRLPKGIKGTENDPALLKEPYKDVVSHITKEENVWSWPARAEGKWRLDPNPEDYITVTTTEYIKEAGIVYFKYVFNQKGADGVFKMVAKSGNLELKHIPKWFDVISLEAA